jgi:2-oxoisovalerate dehydrogenase E2 component (dihydrolipoyl transacylase)
VNTEVTMPKLGDSVNDAVIEEWLVAVGDRVEAGQVLAMAETAKALVEIPSPLAGVVVELSAEIGAELLVGDKLLVIDS